MIYKKSVVLSSLDNSMKKGVLSLENKNGTYSGSVKLYNFIEEPMGVLSLGLLIDGKVHKAGLTRVGYMNYNFGTIIQNLPSSCTCALVSSKNGATEPVLLGAIEPSRHDLNERLIAGLSALNEKNIDAVQEILDENNIEFDDEEEINKEIDECLNSCEGQCRDCLYKKQFYDEVKPVQLNEEFKNDITKGKLRIPPLSEKPFIDEIGVQLDTLFNDYPAEQVLADIIPNSKWVKIDIEAKNSYYVVGLISVEDEVKYICYGIPAKWSEVPPADFNKEAQWLPISLEEPKGEGYWITYQDANDGELIKVDIV